MSRRKHGLSACFPSTQRYCNGDKGLWGALALTPSSVLPPRPQGQLLARSWSSLLQSQAGAAPRGPIYTFNGRNVLTDALW